ncbi:class I SAM-dependent methyltransferase [Cognatitamlana onchidii]|uniref:class I SAM-dependent methyltransferase n=1 Tax=Cognatitamlana onchidii TaxID=2562860 RepID=UPI001F1E10D8|nr:class I SAM-dependent methyltransferase [Algibacter onchidii]
MTKKLKKPWPTKDAMEQIYEKHLWGGKDYDFYSGWGSHDLEIVIPYLNHVTAFLKSFPKPITVCDLGCGDFNIGKHLVKYTKAYMAVDIVDSLIERNKHRFEAVNLEFKCLDISKDEIPHADCVILRQVLQHLSNNEILDVVEKLKPYKYVILTEHLPPPPFTPNIDIISGQGIRLRKKSGVNLLCPPFNLKVRNTTKLLEYFEKNKNGRIVTTLYHL